MKKILFLFILCCFGLKCPDGYTIDPSGIGTSILQIDVPELEIPSLSMSHCYKRVTTSPK